jgi:hypothetical protein
MLAGPVPPIMDQALGQATPELVPSFQARIPESASEMNCGHQKTEDGAQ